MAWDELMLAFAMGKHDRLGEGAGGAGGGGRLKLMQVQGKAPEEGVLWLTGEGGTIRPA